MNKVLYKNSEHTILYKDKKSKIMYKDKPYQDEELNYPSIVLCHFEDDFVNNQITDAKGNILTRNDSGGYITDTYKKFGDKSIIWGGSASTYVMTPLMPELNFLTGDFTIDFWGRIISGSARRCFFSLGINTMRGIQIDITSNTPCMWVMHPTQNRWLIGGDTYDYPGTSQIPIVDGAWNHIAMVRNGGTVTLYINGQIGRNANIGSASLRNFSSSGASAQVGTWGIATTSYPMQNGCVDELRITDKAIWTEAFTPPTKPYNN